MKYAMWPLLVTLLLAPLATLAEGRAAAPACNGSQGYFEAFGGRRTFILRPDWLAATKARGASDLVQAAAWKQLFAKADAALTGATYSVVDKTRTPPSGDKHDYMSMGPYWWPDPKQPNGEPYIRRDGEVNPERNGDAFDATRMDRMGAAVEALSLAYYFSEDKRYALRAAELVRAWFLAPVTRMNPNLSFAQAVPGRTAGRAEGVLDTLRLTRVVEGIGLIAPSETLSRQELAALERWFTDYTTWMMTSVNGREEREADNNHGLWYDHQLVHFALFARRDDIAREVIEQVATGRFEKQIEPDGKLPRELKRTRAYHYTIYALQAATGLAGLSACVNVNLWQTPGATRLEAALSYIAPYVGREREFPYPDLKPGPDEGSFELFSRAAWAYGDVKYQRAARVLAEYNPTSLIQLTIARP
ncbi:MAG: alginate lyase family protein [Steroidobacter sp.]